MATNIYTLSDPRTDMVRYVGKTDHLEKRLSQHLSLSTGSHKSSWIKSLKSAGIKPEMVVIDKVPVEDWEFWEMHYIKFFKSLGAKLVNGTEGGQGDAIVFTDAAKKKMSDSTKGFKHSKETRKKIKKNNARYWLDRKKSKEHIAKMRATLTGRKQPRELVEKRAASMRKVIRTKEWRENISKGLMGKKLSKEHVESLIKGCTRRKPVIQITLDGEFIKRWDSAQQAYNELGISNTGILNCCHEKECLRTSASGEKYIYIQDTAGGFKWKFTNG